MGRFRNQFFKTIQEFSLSIYLHVKVTSNSYIILDQIHKYNNYLLSHLIKLLS